MEIRYLINIKEHREHARVRVRLMTHVCRYLLYSYKPTSDGNV
jgi:hypothetical protein